jgi:hypothetical protein
MRATSKAGRRAAEKGLRRVHRIDTRTAPTLYVIVMAAWVYGFAAVDRELPALFVFVLLLVAGAVQVGVGYLVGRWEAVGLAAIPILLAAAVSGLGSGLFVALVVLMVFPGAPLIAGGVWARRWHEEASDDSPDAWLYGETPSS